MVLSEEQAELFYDLWIPLLDYVNRKYKLCKNYYGMNSPKGLLLDVVMTISSKLWEKVRGIYSSWREMLERFSMPQIIEASLIPFQGIIIHDGIVMPYGVCLGKNLADQVRQMYLNAKKENRIQESILDF